MGKIDDDTGSIRGSVGSSNWSEFWIRKQESNDKLIDAIKNSDYGLVSKLLTDPGLVATGTQADVNFTVKFNGFVLSPLLLAIQFVKANETNHSIIQDLMNAYADLNCVEENTGFTPIIMACHLNTEQDSINVIEMLVNHRFYKGQPMIVNVNSVDLFGCSALHYASHTGKLKLC